VTGHSALRPHDFGLGAVEGGLGVRDVQGDLLAALEAILPHARLAPEWAIQNARDAIAAAKGERP
jgi:hypothetical protein